MDITGKCRLSLRYMRVNRMKISKLVAISLSVVSTGALAFQAKENINPAISAQQMRNVENNILSGYYSEHGERPQISALGTCAAVPVPGCACPYCTALRSIKNGI